MTAMPHPDTVAADQSAEALRAVFKAADKQMRQKLVPILPPGVIEFAGVAMYVDPRDNYTDRMIWRDGFPPEIKSLTALVALVEGRRACIFDIGANSGAFTLPLAAAAGKGSRVIAFEPNPVMVGRLGHNIQLNGLGDVVRIEACALGEAQGEATLNFRRRNYGQASLLPIRPGIRDGGALVPVRTLAEYLGQAQDYDLSVLKIDVEGAEEQVLGPVLDAASALPDALLVETDHTRGWSTDLVGRITERGYDITLQAEQNTLFVRQGAAT